MRIFLVILAIYTCCGSVALMASPAHSQDDLESTRDRLIESARALARNKYNLRLSGCGGSGHEKIGVLVLHFEGHDRLDLDQARETFIGLCDDIIQLVNEDAQARPMLSTYPFTNQNLDVMIGFADHLGGHVPDGWIGLVFIMNGKVCYSAADKTSPTGLTYVLWEQWDEAKAILGT